MKMYTVHEMRDMAEQILHADDDWYEDAGHMLLQAADMMERESTSEKSSAVGNAAAMRETLLKASIVLKEATHHHLTEEYINECRVLLHSALSSPPRNCDAFSKAQVLEMLEDRSFSKEDTIEWLFAKAKGETDGSR